MGIELVIAAIALAFPTLIALATVKPHAAVRFCFAMSLAVVLTVPVTRIDPSLVWLRALVPISLILLTVVAIALGGRPRTGRLGLPLALFIAFTGLVAFFAENEASALIWGLGVAVLLTAVFQGALLIQEGQRDWALKAILFAGVALAAYGIAEYVWDLEPLWRGAVILSDGQSYPLSHPFNSEASRSQATFGHPLPFALVLIVALYLLLKMPGGRALPRLAMFAVIVAGIASTGSRNAMVLAAMVLILVWANGLKALRVPVYLATVVGGTFALLGFLGSDVTETGSFTHRLGALESLETLLTQQQAVPLWFGNSEGGLPALFQSGLLVTDGLEAVDNQFVYLIAAQGILGTALVAIIAVTSWSSAPRTIRGVLLIFAAECLIFDLLGWASTAFVAWLIVGLSSRSGAVPPTADQKPHSPGEANRSLPVTSSVRGQPRR